MKTFIFVHFYYFGTSKWGHDWERCSPNVAPLQRIHRRSIWHVSGSLLGTRQEMLWWGIHSVRWCRTAPLPHIFVVFLSSFHDASRCDSCVGIKPTISFNNTADYAAHPCMQLANISISAYTCNLIPYFIIIRSNASPRQNKFSYTPNKLVSLICTKQIKTKLRGVITFHCFINMSVFTYVLILLDVPYTTVLI
jgi:hypothetical protein